MTCSCKDVCEHIFDINSLWLYCFGAIGFCVDYVSVHTVNTSPIEHRVSSKYSCLLMSSTLVILCIDERKWIQNGDEYFASL